MICKKCGGEIDNGVAYCPLCGAAQKTDAANTSSNLREESKSGCGFGFLVAFLVIAMLAVVVWGFANAGESGKTQGGNPSGNANPGSSSQGSSSHFPSWTNRKAKNEDVILNFSVIPGIFEEDKHYVKVQAQEKITDLRLEISFLDAAGNVLLTQTINVGKVVPGNEYSYRLSLSGMAFKDLDSIKKYSWRVSGGTVEED